MKKNKNEITLKNSHYKCDGTNRKFYMKKKFKKYRIIAFASTKITFDVLLSLIGLLLLSPLFIVISIAIKVDSKGPVFFKQIRTGRGGKEFILYKFRSMYTDNNLYDFATEDKCTRVGTFLRKTSIDELPQLINILRLEMSFIGPRPWIPDYYNNMNEKQRHRYDVRPGITGLAQCKERDILNIYDKINLDLEYIKEYSLKQDIKIIFLTIEFMFCQKDTDKGKIRIYNEIEDLKKQ